MLTGQLPNTMGEMQNLRVFKSFEQNAYTEEQVQHLGLQDCKVFSRTLISGRQDPEAPRDRKCGPSFGHFGTLPKSMSSMKELRFFWIDENNVGGDLAQYKWLGEMPSLRNIDLFSNNFSGRIPSEWQHGFKALRALRLRDNRLTGPLPFDLGCALPNLAYIDLSMNELHGNVAVDSDGSLEVGYMNSACTSLAEHALHDGSVLRKCALLEARPRAITHSSSACEKMQLGFGQKQGSARPLHGHPVDPNQEFADEMRLNAALAEAEMHDD
jgi:hypothetical protein